MEPRVGSKGVRGVVGFTRKDGFSVHHSSESALTAGVSSQSSVQSVAGKQWKRHNNSKKREKLRRVTGHLDA